MSRVGRFLWVVGLLAGALSCAPSEEPDSAPSPEEDVVEPAPTGPRLVRFEPDGPAGIGLVGEGGEREHIYYESETGGLVSAGVWEADPYESGPDTLQYSEFMYFLDGEVTLVDESGREETFRAGDAAVVPRGVAHYWKQPTTLRKFWVVFDEGDPADPSDRTPVDTFLRFEPHGPSGSLPGEGRTREHAYYEARGDALSAGVWEADPREPGTEPKRFQPDYTELMCLLEGSVTIVDDAGREERIEAGDVVLVPKGMGYRWIQDEYVRKYWVIFDAD